MTSVEKGDLHYLQQTKFCNQWKIERFFGDCEKLGDCYTSPVFLIPYANKNTKWFLTIYPKGYEEEHKNYVSITLNFASENVSEVIVDFQLSIVNEQIECLTTLSESTICLFESPVDYYGWDKFALQDFIKDEKNGFLTEDRLTILCEITFLYQAQDIAKKSKDYNYLLCKIAKGLQDYEELFESNRFSDVTFIVQNQKLHLHKAILSCRNPVFKGMFENEEETPRKKLKVANDVVEIKDANYQVMKEVFRFIYSGKVANIDKIAKGLLIAANKYSVTDLKALCEITLSKNLHTDLTIDTAVEYLKLVNICDTIHLKQPIIEFAVAHSKEIINKPGFQNINNTVIFQIMQGMTKKD